MRLVVGSPHRYPDLARLWARGYRRDLLPALSAAGFEVETVVFADGGLDGFDGRWFPGIRLEAPSPSVPDFVAFYDTLLERGAPLALLLDADLFVLDGAWLAAGLARLESPRTAAVSFLRRAEGPGVWALAVRTDAYRALPRPVFSPCYEGLGDLATARNLQPGDRAARSLRASGLEVAELDPGPPGARLADFHGTTVIRMSRALFEPRIGTGRFVALLAEKPYFLGGAVDNLFLGTLYRSLFGRAFAPGASGRHLAGSATAAEVAAALASLRPGGLLARAHDGIERSRAAFDALVAREGLPIAAPRLLSGSRRVAAALLSRLRAGWRRARLRP